MYVREEDGQGNAREPTTSAYFQDVVAVEKQFRVLLFAARSTLGAGYLKLEYVKVNNYEYLMEVKCADAKRVPNDWIKVNA